MGKFLFLTAALLAFPAQAQNLAPELFVDGSCEDKVAWASRPPEVLKPELDEMLGTRMGANFQGDLGQMILRQIKRKPVTDAWFAGNCTFTDEQLERMKPLHEAYVMHFADMVDGD